MASMTSKKGYQRTDRIAELLKQELAAELLRAERELKVGFVTVSHVTVSRDLALARVYITTLDDDEQAVLSVLKTLNQEKRIFRHALAKKMQLRIVPDLKFYYDQTLERAQRINDKIHAVSRRHDTDLGE